MRRTTRLLGLAALSLLLTSSSVSASTISIVSDGANSLSGLASFTGALSYDDAAGSDGVGVLTLSLTNTSGDGYLTALAMNLPSVAGTSITGVSLTGAPANFELIGEPSFDDGIGAQPFGFFDFGSSTSSAFLGGRRASLGLANGETGTWTFEFTGSGLNSLTVWSFVGALSSDPQGKGPEFLLARFRGFDSGGSDKVPGDPVREEVPEPTALLLLSAGLVGVARARRRGRAPQVNA